MCVVCSDSQRLRGIPVERVARGHFAYGFWIAIGEVYCDCASDRLAIENLQKEPSVENLLQYLVTDDRTIGVSQSCGWAWT